MLFIAGPARQFYDFATVEFRQVQPHNSSHFLGILSYNKREGGDMRCQVFQKFRSALPIYSCAAPIFQAPHEYVALEYFTRNRWGIACTSTHFVGT